MDYTFRVTQTKSTYKPTLTKGTKINTTGSNIVTRKQDLFQMHVSFLYYRRV